jgi:hypothetical protein
MFVLSAALVKCGADRSRSPILIEGSARWPYAAVMFVLVSGGRDDLRLHQQHPRRRRVSSQWC